MKQHTNQVPFESDHFLALAPGTSSAAGDCEERVAPAVSGTAGKRQARGEPDTTEAPTKESKKSRAVSSRTTAQGAHQRQRTGCC